MAALQGSTVSSGYLAAATTHSVTLPTGITAGELLCIYCLTNSQNRKGTATGYTAVDFTFETGSTTSHTLLWKAATGSESGNITITLDPAGSASLVAHAFRLSGVDTTDPFNTANYLELTEGASTATPSIAASTLTSTAGSGFLVALSCEANRDVVSFDADLDTEIGSTAAANSLHVFLDETEAGTVNPLYDFTMSSDRQFNEAIFELKSPAVAGPVITNVNTTNVVQVGDTPVVTGTSFLATGGTQSWGGVSVGFSSWADTSITSTAITRGDLAYNTNYDWIVTDNLAVASTAQSVQLAIETGYQVVTLSSPIIVLVGGYRTSLCYGSVPDCVTGDQLRAPTTTTQGKALTINVDGTFSIAAAGNTEQTFSFEVWDANAATNDKWSASTAVVVNGVIVGGGGILRNVLRSPLKNILRNVLK